MNHKLLNATTPKFQNILNNLAPYISFKDGTADSTYIREKETGKHILGLVSFFGLFVERIAILEICG